MLNITTAERLIHFMKRNIRLSNRDSKFLNNLETALQSAESFITSNQVALLNRIVAVYHRQFAAMSIDSNDLVNLPWSGTVVSSNVTFAVASISIIDDKIILRSPFNSKFLNAFAKTPNNFFLWNKEQKHHASFFSLHNLKFITTITKKYFPNVKYCSTVINILAELEQYSHIRYWNPTLCNVNGNLMVAAVNTALDKAISEIQLNTTVATIAKLTQYGVSIDDELLKETTDDPALVYFASQYETNVEQEQLSSLADWLVKIGCDAVYSDFTPKSQQTSALKLMLAAKNIEVFDTKFRVDGEKYSNFPVLIRWQSIGYWYNVHNIAKIIYVKNSQPIDIK